MREILFKAKRIDNGEWLVGFYCKRKTGHYDNIGFHDEYKDCIIVEFSDGGIAFYDVDQTTICQYTGLTDKKGQKIWENDILECFGMVDSEKHFLSQVEWDNGSSCFMFQDSKNSFVGLDSIGNCGIYSCNVIGNIFDNPELLN